MEALHKILDNKKELFLYLVIIFLTLTTSQFIYFYLIYCGPARNEQEAERILEYEKRRVEIQESILSGNAPAHMQYRVFKPAVMKTTQVILSPLVKDPVHNHLISCRILIFMVFLLTYFFFGKFLRILHSPEISIVGLLLLQAIIPLSIEPNSIWGEGNFYNLMFYTVGLYLMFKNKDQYLPFLFVFGSLNREQFIFFNVFYALYLICEKKLFTKRSLYILTANAFIWLSVYFGLRFYYGFKTNYVTLSLVIMGNLLNWQHITQIWIQEVLMFIILSIVVYKSSNKFFQYSFLSLGLFFIMFSLNGFLNELSKFLPAYLIMIPMALKILEEEIGKKKYPGERILYNDEIEKSLTYKHN